MEKMQESINKELEPGFNNMWRLNFQMFNLDLETAEESEIKLPTSTGSSKSERVPEKHLLLFYWLCQSLWLWGSQQTVKNFERNRNTRQPDLPAEESVCRSRSNNKNWTWTIDWFQIGKKKYIKAVYCHPAYLTFMQSVSWERLD